MAIPFYKASTFTGLVSTKNYGTSEEWNSAFTTVKSNSATWAIDTRSLWGSISGTLSAQTDLWSYLSAVGTSNFDIATLNNYLSTTPVLLSSLNVNGQILSAGTPLHNIFLTTETDAQTLTYIPSSYLLSISNGNTVSLSSLDDKSYVNTNFLSLSGGTLTGNLSVYGNTFINNNLTVGGNLTAIGTATFANTIFTTTSALSVVNTGPGPALYIFQAAGPYDVASFYDGDGIEVLHVGNAGPGGLGKVGINESFPNEQLTVRGNISATGAVFATSILSGGIDLKNIFITSETDSQTLTFTESAAQLTISNGNTVSLSSLQGTYIYTNTSQSVLSNRRYAFDTSSTSLTATLPTSPQIGDEIEFFDITGYWFINNLVIVNNGNYIEQKLETLECDVKFGCIQLIYVGPIDNIGWRIIPKPRHSVPSIISPIVSISSNISLGYDPVTINFAGVNNLDNIVAPVNSWYWNLTGGNTPDYFTQNVSYNYNTPGVYTINLTGSNAVGIGTASKTITALPMLVPVPTISSNLIGLSGYTPLTASFIGLNTLPVSSSPVSNWYWNLTGGNTADYTTQTVTYVYQTSGSYVVSLSASNASGTGTTSVTVTAATPPLAIPSGALAFWKLDNTTDSSGNGNTLVNTNATFGPGKIGNCAQFDGTGNTYLSLNSFSSPFNTASPYTVSLWYNITTLKNYFTLIGCSNTSTFNIHGSNDGKLDINNSAAADVQVASFFTTGSWNHLVVTRDSSNQMRVWKNGTKVYDALATASYSNVPFIDIGFLRTYSSGFATNGKIDAVGIWTRALNQTEIDQLYNGGNGVEP